MERHAKAATLTKETFGATSRAKDGGDGGLGESRAIAAVSGDIKESVCNRDVVIKQL